MLWLRDTGPDAVENFNLAEAYRWTLMKVLLSSVPLVHKYPPKMPRVRATFGLCKSDQFNDERV